MTVPEELLRLRKLRLSESPAPGDGQTTAERGLAGHPAVLVAVAVALADLIIEAGPIVVVMAASLEVSKDVAELARKRPKPNLNRCLDAAAGGGGAPECPYRYSQHARAERNSASMGGIF